MGGTIGTVVGVLQLEMDGGRQGKWHAKCAQTHQSSRQELPIEMMSYRGENSDVGVKDDVVDTDAFPPFGWFTGTSWCNFPIG